MYEVKELTKNEFTKWNEFVNQSNNGTIFHRLDFLSYHGNKFSDNEVPLLILKGNEIFGVLPLAIFELEEKRKKAKSPYGGSFGGWVFRKELSYNESMEVISITLAYLKNLSVDEFILTFPPQTYSKKLSETFRFCLLESGFRLINCDICSIVSNININPIQSNTRVKRNIKKATANNIAIKHYGNIDEFWIVLEKTFQKLNKVPTHSKEEWKKLSQLFPDKIFCSVAFYNDIPVAGLGHIKSNSETIEAFYICSDPSYKELQALSYLISESIRMFGAESFKFYDFGTSSLSSKALPNLFEFKESFGSLGFSRETFSYIF